MKIKIKVTRAVVERAKHCGRNKLAENCVIAEAVRDIFPKATVSFDDGVRSPVIYMNEWSGEPLIKLPISAGKLMELFDEMTPAQREKIPEQSFTVDIPGEITDRIGLGEVYKVLSESKTLELVSI